MQRVDIEMLCVGNPRLEVENGVVQGVAREQAEGEYLEMIGGKYLDRRREVETMVAVEKGKPKRGRKAGL